MVTDLERRADTVLSIEQFHPDECYDTIGQSLVTQFVLQRNYS